MDRPAPGRRGLALVEFVKGGFCTFPATTSEWVRACSGTQAQLPLCQRLRQVVFPEHSTPVTTMRRKGVGRISLILWVGREACVNSQSWFGQIELDVRKERLRHVLLFRGHFVVQKVQDLEPFKVTQRRGKRAGTLPHRLKISSPSIMSMSNGMPLR